MKIEIIKQYYDYSWRLNNPYCERGCYNSNDVNITTHLRVKDIHGKVWELLDNGNRYDNKIYKKSHSRYDLILESFVIDTEFEHCRSIIGHPAQVSDFSNDIFRLCELEQNFDPETKDTIILSKDVRKQRREHYIGFAIENVYFDHVDYLKHPEIINEDPYIQKGIRCEMRTRDKMFHWLNKTNPMNSDDYDEHCQKQTQIIPLNNNKKEALKELNDAIMNEITILDLGQNTLDILDVVLKAQEQNRNIKIMMRGN